MYREQFEKDGGSVDSNEIPLLIDEYQQALSEKDLAIAQANRHKEELFQKLADKDREIAHLQDVYTKQRHKQEDAYQQLMEKAVRFAETVVKIHDFCGVESSDIESSMFLNSPEVQAWKERKT